MVPGHEIAGVVTAVGSKVTKHKIGDKVGVGCFVDSCRTCAECQRGIEQYCSVQTIWTYNGRDKEGAPTYGGYSDRIVVDENYVLRMPNNLPLDACAPLLCAGITLYSPLRHWQAGPGKKVAIVGMGGLGHMGVKLAHALGAEVTVLSQSLKKQADGKRLGADHFYAPQIPETFTKLANSFDLIINTVSAKMDWNQYLSLLRVDGTMVVVGFPERDVPVAAFSLRRAPEQAGGITDRRHSRDAGNAGFLQQAWCRRATLRSCRSRSVNEAYERVLKSDVRYRFVIDMASRESSRLGRSFPPPEKRLRSGCAKLKGIKRSARWRSSRGFARSG